MCAAFMEMIVPWQWRSHGMQEIRRLSLFKGGEESKTQHAQFYSRFAETMPCNHLHDQEPETAVKYERESS